MTASIRLILDNTEVEKLLRSESGPVARDTLARGERVKRRAQELVGKESRDLERSIVKRFARIDGDAATLVGVFGGRAMPYAMLHHEGTRAHDIVPRKAQVLRFLVGNKVVYARRVRHPGTKPNPYLRNALDAAR